MSDIRRIALVVLIVSFYFSTFSNFAYAANDSYDHDALMQYEGYSKAMYDSVVEQTTFLAGQYTDNKDYVRNSMNEIKDYADFWYNEYDDFTSSCYQTSFMNCFGEVVERGGAYALTVGDWLKNLFSDYDESLNTVTESSYAPYFYGSDNRIYINDAYYFTVNDDGSKHTRMQLGWTRSNGGIGKYLRASVTTNINSFNLEPVNVLSEEMPALEQQYLDNMQNPAFILGLVSKVANIKIYKLDTQQQVVEENTIPNPIVNNIYNYINDNGSTVQLPKLQPSLVCPDGTEIQMSISGSTFLSVDGTTMVVNEDGTAQVNSEICNLSWQKPTVKYNDDGKAVIETDQGERDLTNGKIVPGTEPPVNCDGVLCFLSEIVKSITGLVTDVLDGILGLFVPDDLSFITDEFTRITDSLTAKIAITQDLKNMLTGIFTEDETNPLQDITIDLPIVGKPLQFGDMSLINQGVPILKKVISAICILYTLLYVYRKITGRGGVMEK